MIRKTESLKFQPVITLWDLLTEKILYDPSVMLEEEYSAFDPPTHGALKKADNFVHGLNTSDIFFVILAHNSDFPYVKCTYMWHIVRAWYVHSNGKQWL